MSGWAARVRAPEEGDPYPDALTRPDLAGTAATEAVTVVAERDADEISYLLVLRTLATGGLLARTPDYGGPLASRGAPAHAADPAVRSAIDELLQDRGVVSEVFALGPLLPERNAVAAAWGAQEAKRVCITDLLDLDVLRSGLSKGRRSDLARATRECRFEFRPFDVAVADEFGARYAEAMDRLDAADRWRLDAGWFRGVAGRPGLWLSSATSDTGGAAGIFAVTAARASYHLAARWGQAPGASTAVLWNAFERLAALGVEVVNLGGGVTDGVDDPLLRFKASLATRTVPLLLGGRCFDPAGHQRAECAGDARPLPAGYVVP